MEQETNRALNRADAFLLAARHVADKRFEVTLVGVADLEVSVNHLVLPYVAT